jgi:hypothetical protein
MSVADAMAAAPQNSANNLPTTPIVINSVTTVAAVPTFTATVAATGPITAQSLDVTLTPDPADLNKASYVYIVAILPTGVIYTFTPAGWANFDMSKPVAYWSGFLQAQSVNLVSGLDLAALKGTVIVVGYGFGTNATASLTELLSSKRFQTAYTIN